MQVICYALMRTFGLLRLWLLSCFLLLWAACTDLCLIAGPQAWMFSQSLWLRVVMFRPRKAHLECFISNRRFEICCGREIISRIDYNGPVSNLFVEKTACHLVSCVFRRVSLRLSIAVWSKVLLRSHSLWSGNSVHQWLDDKRLGAGSQFSPNPRHRLAFVGHILK